MILFNSDLDNTLIYSYKKDIGIEKYCVEIYEGREISFMSKTSYELLHKVNNQVCFVPTTTRTIEQYERIDFGIGTPKYALICNGGKLLVNGVSDEAWYKKSREDIKACDRIMEQAIQLLECDPHRTFEIRYIDQLFIFTKSDDPDQSIMYLKSILDTEKVDVAKTGEKIYVTPKQLTKGNALLRLKERLRPQMVIAAGDSVFDLSMFKIANLAFAPKKLVQEESKRVDKKEKNRSEQTLCCNREYTNLILHDSEKLFSDEILAYIAEIKSDYIEVVSS